MYSEIFFSTATSENVVYLAVMTDTDKTDSAVGNASLASLASASLAHFPKPELQTSGTGGEKKGDSVAILVQKYVPSTKAANCLNI